MGDVPVSQSPQSLKQPEGEREPGMGHFGWFSEHLARFSRCVDEAVLVFMDFTLISELNGAGMVINYINYKTSTSVQATSSPISTKTAQIPFFPPNWKICKGFIERIALICLDLM